MTKTDLYAPIQQAFGLPWPCDYDVTGAADWLSCFQVSDLAEAVHLQVAQSLAGFCQAQGNKEWSGKIQLDRRLASLWFSTAFQPLGWQRPSIWDAIAGNYAAADSWIRLHTNAPHHKKAALAVLGCAPTAEAVAQAVSSWRAEALEDAIIAQGGVAARMQSHQAWLASVPGQALAAEPLVAWQRLGEGGKGHARQDGKASAPLSGIKVLDLTRVLAGPSCTRLLAGFGARVLRLDPPFWDEEAVAMDMSLGKSCARLDLRQAEERQRFEALVAQADLLVYGYRGGALATLGYDQEQLYALNPMMIQVGLNAYGWCGPWSQRRGFDTIVQQSVGLAHYGAGLKGQEQPDMLPVQALDYATGMLMAAACLQALTRRMQSGEISSAQLSLARTGMLLASTARAQHQGDMLVAGDADYAPKIYNTPWGKMRFLRFPFQIAGQEPHWTLPPQGLHRHPVAWPT